MPQRLEDLRVAEVSLCDAPANASTNPITKKKIAHSRVAIFKRDSSEYVPAKVRFQRLRDTVNSNGERLAELLAKSAKLKDDPGTQDVDTDELKSKKKGKKMPKLKTILKSAVSESSAAFTRDDLYAAVEKKARKIALKKGCSVELAEGRLWESIYKTSGVMDPPEVRREPKMMRVTKAEAELDKRGRKLMKSNPGLGYAQACSKALEQDPALYSAYEKELASGATYLVPESRQPDFSNVGKLGLDEDACPQCGEDIDPDEDAYCAGCGKKLPDTAKRR
jgi:hypothetical protein